MSEQRYQSSVSDMRPRLVKKGQGVANGGDPPNDGDMESRVAALESAVKTLATKADVEKGFGDIKADMHKIDAGHVRWMIATILSLLFGLSAMVWTMGSTLNATTSTLINEVRQSRAAPVPTSPPPSPTVIVVPHQPTSTPEPPKN